MFTWRHFMWLALCFIFIAVIVCDYRRKRPSMIRVLTSACIVCAASELCKVFSVIELVPSAGGELLYPYIPLNHLPLHFCSIQLLIIFYTRFTKDEARREQLYAFLCPTSVLGGLMALFMPSIFSTTIPVEKAFTAPVSYQFFLYHTMMVALGLIILNSDEVKWNRKHMFSTVGIVLVMGFASLYVNSIMASPTYRDGKLISVDFWTNFFFTTMNPLGIRLTEKWQWCVYFFLIGFLASGLIIAFYEILIFRRQKKKN
ncbi:MAG: hypothetical protein E7240_03620 [Lachnospiraceae bacterium]|nr:hypothetical protein [Lachnospiraceae bacterium]